MSPGGVYQVTSVNKTLVHYDLTSCCERGVDLTSNPCFFFQAPINFSNSEFYGFSEFFYCTEDVLRLGGQYDSQKYSRAAMVRTYSLCISKLEDKHIVLVIRRQLSGCVCFGCPAGLLLHQVVDTETASGQQAVLSAGRHQQTQVSSARFHLIILSHHSSIIAAASSRVVI